MNYISTREKNKVVSSAKAITAGISPEGGLFVPETFSQLSHSRLLRLSKMSYVERAKSILADYLTDFSDEELYHCVSGAYTPEKFGEESITQLAKLGDEAYLLELWHGPTSAFKDMALQLLPRLLTVAAQKTADGKEIVILVATSGDTGKAALEGFCNVPGTRILVFYPQLGVSPMQRLQMATQVGENVNVCAIEGNFDDAQTAVKQIFTDHALAKRLQEHGMMFSSANSINWGRLLPQIVYYISTYCDLLADEEIALGDRINICVPTGNFGNILAAYYAKKMGLPVGKLICASNQNNVLTEFLRTGTYNRNRAFHTTISPSMDILVSSNLERLLFTLSGNDDASVRTWMQQLKETGSYTVSPAVLSALQAEFWGTDCDDKQTKNAIAKVFASYHYLCDTHTAVAMHALWQYEKETGDHTKTIVASTASPFKFSHSVLEALGETPKGLSEFELAAFLEQKTGASAPEALLAMEHKTVRFEESCKKEDICSYVLKKLNLA